ncbi:MAG: hypothetical protein R3B45_02030 [Bdellovibrionota bacterium]
MERVRRNQLRIQHPFYVAILLLSILSSCADSIFPDVPTKKKSTTIIERQNKPLQSNQPKSISNSRLLRRITIDLLNHLPSLEDSETIISGEVTIEKFSEQVFNEKDVAKAIAERHARFWNLLSTTTPELERFALIDTNLKSLLTNEIKEKILHEPINNLRYLLELKKPFTDLFTTSWSIVHDDVANIWGDSSTTSPWKNEAFKLYTFQDNRPKMGILNNRGFNASIETGQSTNMISYTSSVLKILNCSKFEKHEAHLFYSLSESDLLNLPQSAISNPSCSNCHRQIQYIAPSLSGNASGSNLASWLQYTSNNTGPSYFSGIPFNDEEELASILSQDPRSYQCEFRNLMENILQRPLLNNENDLVLYASILDAFEEEGQNIIQAIRPIIFNETYKAEIQDKNVRKKILGLHSGAKILTRSIWKGIINNLSPISSTIEIPYIIEPGIDDLVDAVNFSPSGYYFASLKQFVKKLTNSIVNDELSAGRSANERILLTQLPDGSGYSDDLDLIHNQLISLWTHLTSMELDENSLQFDELFNLWNAGFESEDNIDNKSKTAWKLVLAGIFLSPEFILY